MSDQKTTEQMLKAIIRAQIKTRKHLDEQYVISETIRIHETGGVSIGKGESHVLQILLDPQGLKAAYGYYVEGQPDWIIRCANNILLNWIASDGDAAATIRTAFDLLPLNPPL